MLFGSVARDDFDAQLIPGRDMKVPSLDIRFELIARLDAERLRLLVLERINPFAFGGLVALGGRSELLVGMALGAPGKVSVTATTRGVCMTSITNTASAATPKPVSGYDTRGVTCRLSPNNRVTRRYSCDGRPFTPLASIPLLDQSVSSATRVKAAA